MSQQTKNGDAQQTGGLDPFIDISNCNKASVEWKGQTIAIDYIPITREIRDDAFWEAVEAFKQDHPNMTDQQFKNSVGFKKSVFDRIVATRVIQSWSLNKPVHIGWRELPAELGDKIANAVGIDNALKTLRSYNTEETEDARNLSQGGEDKE